MRILVATSGVLSPPSVADLCDRLLQRDGSVTLMTVVQVPRTFLASLDEEERRSLLDDGYSRADAAEAKAARYLEERGRRLVDPLLAAFRAQGHQPEVRFVEGDDPADAIVSTAEAIAADLIVMGATRRLFTEQSWTSISARVMERALCPLVLVPVRKTEETMVGSRQEE